MSRKANLLFVPICLFCVVQCGCLLNHSNHSVVRQDEPLAGITFESEQTRAIFESSAREAMSDDSNKSSASFAVPFLVGLERSKRVAPNAIRNDVVTRFDINRDGHISKYEASLQSKTAKR